MKRIKLFLALVAIVLGVGTAFKANAHKQTTLYWFDTNASGTPLAYNPDGPACSDPTGDICGKEYRDDQLNFDSQGQPTSVKSTEVNNQVDIAHLMQ